MTDEQKSALLEVEASAIACGALEKEMREKDEAVEEARVVRNQMVEKWSAARRRWDKANQRYFRLLNGIPEPAEPSA